MLGRPRDAGKNLLVPSRGSAESGLWITGAGNCSCWGSWEGGSGKPLGFHPSASGWDWALFINGVSVATERSFLVPGMSRGACSHWGPSIGPTL